MSEVKRCTECRAYHGHGPYCSLMSEEYAKSQLKIYHKAWEKLEMERRKKVDVGHQSYLAIIKRLKVEIEKWKGKFDNVKHENNQLRKKLK